MDETKPNNDPINHPSHYTTHPAKCSCGKQIECLQIVEHMPFLEGNVIKYLWRMGKKVGSSKLEDLKKAAVYLNRAIELEVANEQKPDAIVSRGGGCSTNLDFLYDLAEFPLRTR